MFRSKFFVVYITVVKKASIWRQKSNDIVTKMLEQFSKLAGTRSERESERKREEKKKKRENNDHTKGPRTDMNSYFTDEVKYWSRSHPPG